VKEIVESVSAKEEYKRAGFNEMVELCKKKQVDFIIIDEPKRLSRNNIDTSRIIDLMDKDMIRGIYATSRQYLSTNSRDKFLLQLDLSLSKMDNEDRANDIKTKMLTCAKRGQCLWKAPFGYRNITVRKWHKSVIIEPREAEVVRMIFQLRKEHLTHREIDKRVRAYYPEMKPFAKSTIYNILSNRFYIGKTQFDWNEYEGQHESIIDITLFHSVQDIGTGTWVKSPNIEEKYPLKAYIKDENGVQLNGYTTKGITYYKSQSRSDKRVNIRESKLYEELESIVKNYDESWVRFSLFSQEIIRDIIEQKLKDKENQLKSLRADISSLESRASGLLDMRLDNKISEEIFDLKNGNIMQEIQNLKVKEESLQNLQIEKIQRIYEKMVELSGNLYRSYKWGDILHKSNILKNMMVELSVSTKKELTIKENKLFWLVKSFNFQYGGPAGARTRDLRIKSPALYQLSYRSKKDLRNIVKFSENANFLSCFVSVGDYISEWYY
jgi:site-specific DNA recombinase